MYFDAYLKGRNQNHPNNHPQNINNNIQSTHKFTNIRPPIPQPNLVINKPPSFNQVRVDHHKPNTSAHIFLSAAKNVNIPPKINNNYQVRPQTNIGNVTGATFSRHQLTDDKKYICHSPVKINNRTSAGLVFQQIPQNRFTYRRSQSITDLTSNESFHQSNIKNNMSTLRTTLECQPSSDSCANNNSPLQVKFNASNGYAVDKVNRLMKKQSADGRQLTNREQRCDYKDYQINTFRNNNQSAYQSKPIITNYQSNPRLDNYTSKHYQQGNYDVSLRKFEIEAKKTDSFRPQEPYKISTYPSLPSAPLQFMRRQSSQQFLKKYSGISSRIPQLDKTLDKDIETLKLTHKKSEQVIEKQMSKNVYLNQLFQQNAPRNHINDKRGSIEDKRSYAEERRVSIEDRNLDFRDGFQQRRQLQAKVITLQKQIEEKKKQLFEKNKELSQKSKTIIDKNKQIESIASQLRDFQQKYNKIVEKESTLNETIVTIEKDKTDKGNKILLLEAYIKQSDQQSKIKLNEKINTIETIQNQLQQRNSKVNELQKDILCAKESITRLNQIIKDKDSQYEGIVSKLKQQINQLKQQSERISNVYKNQMVLLKDKSENQRLSLQQINHQSKDLLQNQIQELIKNNSLLKQDLSTLDKQYHQISNLYQKINEKYLQIGILLQFPPSFKHQKLIVRIRQLMESTSKAEPTQVRQIQKIQQQHLERRHVQLNRQLKKVGSRLAGVSIQAQQGGRLLRDANNHIFLMNLVNLNEKYRYLLESQQ